MASSYQGKNRDGQDVVEGQSPLIKEHVIESLVNFNIAEDDPHMGTVRSFNPVTDINGIKIISFGFSISSFWNGDVLRKADDDEMFIKWYGYGERSEVPDTLAIFKTLDWDQIQNFNFRRKDFENKIVLIGFLGETVNQNYSPNDKFYSPLNDKIIGRSLPDICGLEIHANIIKMIIDDDFIFHSRIIDYCINYSIVFIFSMILFWTHQKYGKQYSIFSKIILIIFIDLIVFLAIEIFHQTNGGFKILIANGLFIMLFLPDTYEFLESNLFNRGKFLTVSKNVFNRSYGFNFLKAITSWIKE